MRRSKAPCQQDKAPARGRGILDFRLGSKPGYSRWVLDWCQAIPRLLPIHSGSQPSPGKEPCHGCFLDWQVRGRTGAFFRSARLADAPQSPVHVAQVRLRGFGQRLDELGKGSMACRHAGSRGIKRTECVRQSRAPQPTPAGPSPALASGRSRPWRCASHSGLRPRRYASARAHCSGGPGTRVPSWSVAWSGACGTCRHLKQPSPAVTPVSAKFAVLRHRDDAGTTGVNAGLSLVRWSLAPSWRTEKCGLDLARRPQDCAEFTRRRPPGVRRNPLFSAEK